MIYCIKCKLVWTLELLAKSWVCKRMFVIITKSLGQIESQTEMNKTALSITTNQLSVFILVWSLHMAAHAMSFSLLYSSDHVVPVGLSWIYDIYHATLPTTNLSYISSYLPSMIHNVWTKSSIICTFVGQISVSTQVGRLLINGGSHVLQVRDFACIHPPMGPNHFAK